MPRRHRTDEEDLPAGTVLDLYLRRSVDDADTNSVEVQEAIQRRLPLDNQPAAVTVYRGPMEG